MSVPTRFRCAVVLAALLFSFSARDSSAQLPPPGVTCPTGWLLGVEIFQNVVICPPSTIATLEVWFCYPDPSGGITPREQLVIKAIRNQGANQFPCPLTGIMVRQLAEWIMFDRNPAGWTVPVNCSPWCLQYPDCPCPALYPQWTAVNGSCGKVVPDGSDVSVVMCGEVDGEGQNCYYSYQVCKKPNGSIWKRWVGKQIQLFCPGGGMSPECTMPLCDDVGMPEEPTGEGCPEPPPTVMPSNPDLSSIETANDSSNETSETMPKAHLDTEPGKGSE